MNWTVARHTWLLLKLIDLDKLVDFVHLCRCHSWMLAGRGCFFFFSAGWLRQMIWLCALCRPEWKMLMQGRAVIAQWGIFLHYYNDNQRGYTLLSFGPVLGIKKAKIHCKCKAKSQFGIFNNLVVKSFTFGRIMQFEWKMDLDWIIKSVQD